MEIKLEVDIEKFRYSIVGDRYLLEEVESMEEEKLTSILKNRIYRHIEIEYKRSREYGLIDRKI